MKSMGSSWENLIIQLGLKELKVSFLFLGSKEKEGNFSQVTRDTKM